MKNNAYILFLLTLILFSSCKNQEKAITEVKITAMLDSVGRNVLQNRVETTAFSFCDLVPNKEWDSIAVIAPYSNEANLKGLEIKNLNEAKTSILSASLNENHCVLAYINHQNIVGYSVVNRTPIDFTSKSKAVYTIKKTKCNQLFLKKLNDSLLSVQTEGK